jgi:uncharacterized YccA/Bax inhibitor family protein
MRTANPALNDKTFTRFGPMTGDEGVMSVGGTVNKTSFLLLLLVAAASWTWYQAGTGDSSLPLLMIGGAIGGLIVALLTVFKQRWSPFTAPLYALLEGLFLGGVSAIANTAYPGIVIQAVALTFGALFCLLLAYRSGLIRATENFKLGVVAATGAVALFYLASFVLGFFGIQVPLIHDNGWWGIAFSLVVVVIAALNLVLDFDFIEHGAAHGAPRYMEWYAGFGLLVTLIWLYLEILRLLMKLYSRRD